MRYDKDTYHNQDDLWEDELDLNTDGPGHPDIQGRREVYTSEISYTPYQAEDSYENDRVADHSENDDNAENAENAENDYYSEPEPQASRRRRLRGLFRRKEEEDKEEQEETENGEEEYDEPEPDDDNDFYDSPAPAKQSKAPKTPKLDPEDPDYWIVEEESPLSGIITNKGKKWKWILAAVVAFLVLILFAWIWFLRPHTDNAVKYGYINNMERRGLLIKTFEGKMIPYKELGDPDPFYFKEVRFSVESDSLAAQMKRMMLGCVPVRVEYELYHAPLPWKGEEKMIILKADTADPRKILPPEYRGKL